MDIKVSIGEIVDKLSILQIKKENITDKNKLENINNEFAYLDYAVFVNLEIEEEDYNELLIINRQLWNIEDQIRIKEKNKEFDGKFIELARSVYMTNDKRAEMKKYINLKYNSFFKEEKSYEKY